MKLLGYVSATTKSSLIANAVCVVVPAFAEGFGLPIAEGFAHGTPVACADTELFHEVAGDLATYFNPYDPISIADAVNRLDDGQRPSRDSLMTAAKRFSTEADCTDLIKFVALWEHAAAPSSGQHDSLPCRPRLLFRHPRRWRATGLELCRSIDADLMFGYRTADSYGDMFPPAARDLKLPKPLRRGGLRILSLALVFARQRAAAARHGTRVFSGICAPFAAPRRGLAAGRNILYCHTPPRFLYDQRQFYSDRLGGASAPFKHAALSLFRSGYETAVSRMDLIVANSRTVQASANTWIAKARWSTRLAIPKPLPGGARRATTFRQPAFPR